MVDYDLITLLNEIRNISHSWLRKVKYLKLFIPEQINVLQNKAG